MPIRDVPLNVIWPSWRLAKEATCTAEYTPLVCLIAGGGVLRGTSQNTRDVILVQISGKVNPKLPEKDETVNRKFH